jgi:hypothetical protein
VSPATALPDRESASPACKTRRLRKYFTVARTSRGIPIDRAGWSPDTFTIKPDSRADLLRNSILDSPFQPHSGIAHQHFTLFDVNQSDVTGTVNMASPEAVADAVCNILGRRYEDFDEVVVRDGFLDIEDIFWGRRAGLLPCDTPYHDLRHSMSTALAMARMIDGYEASRGGSGPAQGSALGSELATLGVLLALFHDVGFIRRLSEAGINGACLIRNHEQRGVDFMRGYLAAGRFAHFAELADLIHATDIARCTCDILDGLDPELVALGKMLGTSDLISQISGRYYLERCRHFLFHEFVVAGVDRTTSPSGQTVILYPTPEDLLRKTPGFYECLVKPRLDNEFSRSYRYIAAHFRGDDPYARSMQRNFDFLRGMIERNDFSRLRRKPVPLMPPSAH